MVLNRFIGYVLAAALLFVSVPVAANTVADSDDDPKLEALLKEMVARADSMRYKELSQLFFMRGKQFEPDDPDTAWSVYQIYLAALKRSVMIEFSISSEYGRASYWSEVYANIRHIQRFAVRYMDLAPELGELAYDYELFSKSLQLTYSQMVRRMIESSGDAELINDWRMVLGHRETIETLGSWFKQARPEIESKRRSVTPADTALLREIEQFDYAETLYVEMDNKSRELEGAIVAAIIIRNLDTPAYFKIECSDVRDALGKEEAVVEYFVCPAEDGTALYYAAILTPDAQYPRIIPICSEDAIRSCLGTSPDHRRLYATLWRPLEAMLSSAKEVYVIPAGTMHIVPFAGMHDEKGYLCDRYKIHHLLSGKDVVDHKANNTRPIGKTALLVGGADYDMMPDTAASGTEVAGNRQESEVLHAALRSVRGQGFGYLPGSLAETNSIYGLLDGQEWKVRLLSDISATETGLRNSITTEKADILHISTHGFHIPAAVGEDDPNRNIFRISDNPLMRSGLAFSGVNIHWNKGYDPDITDDGVLTALEISRLDLSQTRLVVLSACNTALGETDPVEGVYGLQRALRLAGAGAMIVSLWEVSDRETADFMQSFYTNLLEGRTPKEAFDTTQKKARLKNPGSPHLWAGFVMIE